jgi:hypothetical protein
MGLDVGDGVLEQVIHGFDVFRKHTMPRSRF